MGDIHCRSISLLDAENSLLQRMNSLFGCGGNLNLELLKAPSKRHTQKKSWSFPIQMRQQSLHFLRWMRF
jgi:hypothetical protein